VIAAETLDRWSRAIRDLGFPSVVTLILLWALLHLLPERIDRLVAAMERSEAVQGRLIEQVNRLLERSR